MGEVISPHLSSDEMSQPQSLSGALFPPPPAQLGKLGTVIRRFVTAAAFVLIAKRKIARTDEVRVRGLAIKVPPTVFHPKLYFSSQLLANQLLEHDLRNKRVLDMGCGSGILSLTAARQGATVIAADINLLAVETTKTNARLNKLDDRVEVLHSDLFESIPASAFDCILLNPPFYSGEPADVADRAWRAGADDQFIRRFANKAQTFLSNEGFILCVLSSDGSLDKQIKIFQENGFSLECLRSKRVLFERLYILKITPILSPSHSPHDKKTIRMC